MRLQRSIRERLQTQVRAASLDGLMWDAGNACAKTALCDLGAVIDIGDLTALGTTHEVDGAIAVTFISQEYAGVGLNWVEAMRRIGWRNYLVIAGDEATYRDLCALAVPCVESRLEITAMDSTYVSSLGFTHKGLAMTAMKFPIVHTLLRLGLNVIMSDADTVWLKSPVKAIGNWNVDVAFQRVVYFPRAIAKLWGFAACSGFACFRSSAGTIALLKACIDEHQGVQDDQVAINLALLSAGTCWERNLRCPALEEKRTDADLISDFRREGKRQIRGRTTEHGLDVVALPHDQFWRHNWFDSDLSEMIVCHPNTEKSDSGKRQRFKELGLWYVGT